MGVVLSATTTNFRRAGMSGLLNWVDDPWVSHAANVAQLVGIPLAAIALWIAAGQLRDAAKTANKAEAVAEAQAVLVLDLVLAQHAFIDLRAKLAKGKIEKPDENTQVNLRRYVAAFERLGMLVDKDVVSPELAEAFYGSRLQKLIDNAPSAVDMVDRSPNAWRNFVILCKTLDKHWKEDNNRPRAPSPP
jgi:hypothetical protein